MGFPTLHAGIDKFVSLTIFETSYFIIYSSRVRKQGKGWVVSCCLELAARKYEPGVTFFTNSIHPPPPEAHGRGGQNTEPQS